MHGRAAKKARQVPNPHQLACGSCRREVTELIANGEDVECPFQCATGLCSLECFLEHKMVCENRSNPLPLFSERWSGERSPLTRAVLLEGINVERPFGVKVSPLMDIFSETGRAIWDDLDQADPDAEHHAPDCKSFSRARGKPFWIGEHPPALCDEHHVMGFSNLKGQAAVQAPRKSHGTGQYQALHRAASEGQAVQPGAPVQELHLVYEGTCGVGKHAWGVHGNL